MSLKERPPLIRPEVGSGVRDVLAEMHIDHVMADQLVHEILSTLHYDKPFDLLFDLTRDPVTITRRPDGEATYDMVINVLNGKDYGDCVNLCYKLIENPLFKEWWQEVLLQTRLLTTLFLIRGSAPKYFLLSQAPHFWLSVFERESGESVVIDPSFKSLNNGEGYYASRESIRRVDRSFQTPKGGMAKVLAGKYHKAGKGSCLIDYESDSRYCALGMAPNGKVLEFGFARGEKMSDPIIPMAGLVSRDGTFNTYLDDPNQGIVNAISRAQVVGPDLQVLRQFFEIAAGFEYRNGQF